MANIQIGTTLNTLTAFSATSELTNFTRDRMCNPEFPLREWRSNNQVTQQDLIYDLGSSKAIAGIALLGTNYTTVQLATGAASGGPYTDLPGSPFTITQDLTVGRYKRFVAPTAPPSARYVRQRITAQTPVDGAAYFRCAGVVIVSALTTFAVNPRDFSVSSGEQYYGSTGSKSRRTERYLTRVSWSQENLRVLTQLDDWQELARVPEDDSVLAFFNVGDNAEVFLLRREGEVEFPFSQNILYRGAHITLSEWIGPVFG